VQTVVVKVANLVVVRAVKMVDGKAAQMAVV